MCACVSLCVRECVKLSGVLLLIETVQLASYVVWVVKSSHSTPSVCIIHFVSAFISFIVWVLFPLPICLSHMGFVFVALSLSLSVIFTVGVFRQLSGSVVKTIIWRCSLAQQAVFGALPIVGWDIWLSTLQTSCPQNSTLIVCVRLLWLPSFLCCVLTVSYCSTWSPTGCIVWLIYCNVQSQT